MRSGIGSGLVWFGGKSVTIFIPDQDFTVENLVVSKDTGDHLLVEVLGRRLEGDFLTPGFLELEVDVSESGLVCLHFKGRMRMDALTEAPCSIEYQRHPIHSPAGPFAPHVL